ncbi:GNAT family N-acetyltransferase [Aliikangiella sp. IMCC44653]
MPQLRSARLMLTLMEDNESDNELLFELDQDPEVMRFITGGVVTSRQKFSQVMLPRMEQYRNPDKGWGLWKAVTLSDNQFIGWILIRPMEFFSDTPQFDNLEIGWRFMRKSWGHGYATEAADCLLKGLTQQQEVSYFTALADKHNAASINIMKKLGMKYLKTAIHKDPLGDSEAVFYQLKVN